jgi:hypothetical protein
MADIGNLPPVYRITPVPPGSGAGNRNEAPQRKQDGEQREHERRRQRRKDDDDASHIDEYA